MARIVGTSGRDVLRGTSGNDKIIGKGGNDKIIGKGGNDKIIGGSGNDKIYGGSGNDKIYGGSGDDNIKGGSGNDKIKCNDGNDTANGNSGNDKLYGDDGSDTIIGSKGADDMWGGAGGDTFVFRGGDGFDAQFVDQGPVNAPSLPNTFDDVIHDYTGELQSGTDKLDVPSPGITFYQVTAWGFDGGFAITYGDDVVNWVGSFFIADTVPDIALADFI